MRRRAILLAIGLSILTAALPAVAQPPPKVPRIGWLIGGSPAGTAVQVEAFRQGLRDLGYIEGKSIALDYRYAEGKYDRLPRLAAELVRLEVRIIVTVATPACRAAQQATKTIPIVMALCGDPVESGLVASLGRPGGNVTGLTTITAELSGKRVELLKDVLPVLSRVAVLRNPLNPIAAHQSKGTEGAARVLGLRVQYLDVREPQNIAAAIAGAKKGGAEALIGLPDVTFLDSRRELADLALTHRLPSIYQSREHAEVGALMTYGANNSDLFRQAATYVDKILKGAKPADLPVEQPMRFELVVNLKTAKALSLPIPQSVLIRAGQVIQ